MTDERHVDRFDHAVTHLASHEDAHAGDARRLRDALGVGRVVKSLARVGVVDVTVVVGADFASTRGTSTTSRGATP